MDPAAQVELDAMAYVKPIDEATERGDSNIQIFYKNATVFFTGGTGFIGKQLIEKLFRSCDIKKAFVLIRPKKGTPTKERLQIMMNDSVFDAVRKKKPDLENRIVCVEGDVADIRLGISDADWNVMTEEVDIIFHVAATTRFDEAIRKSTLINVRGTREALKLGKACKKLRSFIHVSTVYSHATTDRVGGEVLEQFYTSPIPPETMLALADTVDSSRLDLITPSLISGWPNTYTFTKAIAEELVHAEAENLPVCIVRPSIVLCTYREPTPGWLDVSCMYGASGIVLGTVLGFIRAIYVNNTKNISFVPVDFVNNATIAAGWETAVEKSNEVKIYNISNTNCGVTFKHISNPLRTPKGRCLVSPKSMWYYYGIETSNRYLYWFLVWILHYIPAYVIDGAMKALQLKKPQGLKSFIHAYTKYEKLSSILSYFLLNEWNFDDSNLKSLWGRMSDTEKTIFNFEIETIDWPHYSYMWFLGIRKYIIKDGLTGTKAGIARQKWFKVANYVVVIAYIFVFWMILNFMWHVISSMF